jgi:23S rRNA (cytosine1962-C5)-methyltransferase
VYPTARVTRKGADRWSRGHPWIYRSDVRSGPDEAGLCQVLDPRSACIGVALFSPRSEIRLRMLTREASVLDAGWWRRQLEACLVRRTGIDATAYRVVHGEGDGLPSLIVDRYDRYLVVQLLSAGLDALKDTILAELSALLQPAGILLRNDVGVRRREGLDESVSLAAGSVPEEIEVREGAVRYLAAPWTGQKTGAFLDQRTSRLLAGDLMRPDGQALDCFTYHGSFAMHLAARASRVTAIDASTDALARGAANAALNGFRNIEWMAGDVFEVLRRFERERRRFDLVVVDPPAFAKTRGAVPQAMRGYKEVNLRAMRLLTPAGVLVTASCSFHVRRPEFLAMLEAAAADSGHRLVLTHLTGQPPDHPEVLTIPETGYLKGAVLQRQA